MPTNSLEIVRAALIKSGYSPEGILSAHYYKKSSSGDEIYIISFRDDEGNMDRGKVYIDQEGKGEF